MTHSVAKNKAKIEFRSLFKTNGFGQILCCQNSTPPKKKPKQKTKQNEQKQNKTNKNKTKLHTKTEQKTNKQKN